MSLPGAASRHSTFCTHRLWRCLQKEGSIMWNKKLKAACLLTASVVGAFAGVSATRANSIEVGSVTTTLNAGVWDYAYTMVLSANNSLSLTNPFGSSLFEFFDASGLTGTKASFTSGSTPSADWHVIVENTWVNWTAGQSTILSQG